MYEPRKMTAKQALDELQQMAEESVAGGASRTETCELRNRVNTVVTERPYQEYRDAIHAQEVHNALFNFGADPTEDGAVIVAQEIHRYLLGREV